MVKYHQPMVANHWLSTTNIHQGPFRFPGRRGPHLPPRREFAAELFRAGGATAPRQGQWVDRAASVNHGGRVIMKNDEDILYHPGYWLMMDGIYW